MQIIQTIQNRIYEIRGESNVRQGFGSPYEVETRVLNQSVK